MNIPVELLAVTAFSSVIVYYSAASPEEMRLMTFFITIVILIINLIIVFYHVPLITDGLATLDQRMVATRHGAEETSAFLEEESRHVEEHDDKLIVTTVYRHIRPTVDTDEVREMVDKTPLGAETPTEYSGEFADLVGDGAEKGGN